MINQSVNGVLKYYIILVNKTSLRISHLEAVYFFRDFNCKEGIYYE